MRIACLSDTHADSLPHIDDCDVVFHTGDFLCHSHPGFYNFRKEVAYVNKILAPWCDKILRHKELWIVCGNHDYLFQNDFHLLPEVIKERTLINRAVGYKGVKIYGTPFQPYYGGWAFNKQDIPDSLGQIYSLIPEDTDILLTHCPPYGILDQNKEGEHCGSRMLAARIANISPKFHCYGHIHHSRGTKRIGNTTFVNGSVLDDNYILRNKPILLEYT